MFHWCIMFFLKYYKSRIDKTTEFSSIKTKLLLIIATSLYLSVFLNIPIFLSQKDHLFAFVSLIFVFSLNYFVFSFIGFFGNFILRLFLILSTIISSICIYFMVFFGSIIDYGIIISVFQVEDNLKKSYISFQLFAFVFIFGVLPSLCIYKAKIYNKKLGNNKNYISYYYVASFIISFALFVLIYSNISDLDKRAEEISNTRTPSHDVYSLQTYVPANWMFSLILYCFDEISKNKYEKTLFDPSKSFKYVFPKYNDDIIYVVVVGESTRYDHLGLFGYQRNTTPFLSKEKNVIGLRNFSCDTLTKNALKCMFVRPGGTDYDPVRNQPILKEQNVFHVFSSLGFSVKAFSTQAVIDFYMRSVNDGFKIAETYGAENKDINMPLYDGILLKDLENTVKNHEKNTMIILHTLGAHYKYTTRYPKNFSLFNSDYHGTSSKEKSDSELIAQYDNAILYSDYFLSRVISIIKPYKAVLIYAPDHGESLGENGIYYHGSPKLTAPIEQRKVPIVYWASDSFLRTPDNLAKFDIARSNSRKFFSQETLFDSMLDCVGISSSNGGLNRKNSWCSKSAGVSTLKDAENLYR